MVTHSTSGGAPLERLRSRFENSETKCPECGYVDEDTENWKSYTDGRQIVYHHLCPSCDAAREYVFHISK